MKKVVIFDFDGVIINSHCLQEKSLEVAYREVVGEGDIPFTKFFELSGDSLENIFDKLYFPREMLKIYRTYSSNNMKEIKIHEGIENILQTIKKIGGECALCTGKERLRTIEILKYLNLDYYFNPIVCSDEVVYPKPNPESIYKILSTLSISKENAIMIGDGCNDIKAAKSAGIGSIAASWGDVNVEELAKEQPDIICDNMVQLKKVIEKFLDN